MNNQRSGPANSGSSSGDSFNPLEGIYPDNGYSTTETRRIQNKVHAAVFLVFTSPVWVPLFLFYKEVKRGELTMVAKMAADPQRPNESKFEWVGRLLSDDMKQSPGGRFLLNLVNKALPATKQGEKPEEPGPG